MQAKLGPLFEAAVDQRKVPGIGAFLVDDKGHFLLKETFGTNNLDDSSSAKFDFDTLVPIFSCTKLITSIAALQLMEQGKLSLLDAVEKYVPRISKVQILESFTADDKPKPVLRPTKSAPTILQLLTHTAGFTYDFFDPLTVQYRQYQGRKPSHYYTTGEWEDFETPLIADPGTKYSYGISTDWLGFVVEAASQTHLSEYINENILKPLAMSNTSGNLPAGKARLIMHLNINDRLVANSDIKTSEEVPLLGGGAYLYSTMNDYAKLLATLLNQGRSPDTQMQILMPETVQKYLFTDHLPADIDRSLLGESGSSIPALSSPGCFLPTLSHENRGWSCALLLNQEDLPRGRNKGSGGWAGLGNLYYWIDPTAKVAGMVCSAILPYFNPTVLSLFDQLERVAYGHEIARPGDEGEGNHRVGLP
jgi:methyl acetate hydrolase